MEQLASLFVSLALLVNTITPSGNLPNVLGIETESLTPEKKELLRKRDIKTVKDVFSVRSDAKKKLEVSQEEVKKEEFKKKVETITDERKRKALFNLDEGFSRINKNRTEHYRKILEKLSNILTKIELKLIALEESDNQVPEVENLISEIKDKISETGNLIDSQESNVYVIAIETEENLGENVSTVKSQFKSDIGVIEEKIKEIKNLLRELINKINEK